MDSELIQNILLSEIPKLPQKEHVPLERARTFLEKLIRSNPKADLKWIIDRMGGIGGSESAAILNHYFKSATNSNFDNNVEFKDARDISLEKLMLSIPFQIPQASRGNRIERMISEIFMTRYSLHGHRDHDAMEAAKRHATNPYMVGNVDDVFLKGKRILADYKSSNSHLEKTKYSHTVQLNQYQENMRSNGFEADLSVVVTLSAPEEVLLDLAKIYEERNERPEDYKYFVNAIANERFSFAKLTVEPVQTTPEFGSLISEAIHRFMHEYPLAGKIIESEKAETVLVGETLVEAEQIASKMFQVMSAEQAIAQVKQALVLKANSLAEKVDGTFEWPTENIPLNISENYSTNYSAGINALELCGFDKEKIYKLSDEIDLNLLIQKFQSNGGVLDESVYKKIIDKEKYQNALVHVGLKKELFESNEGIKFNYSRKATVQDQIYSSQINLQSKIVDAIEEAIFEEEQNNQKNSPSLSV